MPASGMPAFGSAFRSEQIDAVVSYLRDLQGRQKSSLSSGNAEAGRIFFTKARCLECHSVDGKGGFVASDLSGYGKAHSPDELRQQILEHKEEKERQITQVLTRGGESYEGIIRNEDNFSLQLQTLTGDFLFLEKAKLVTVEHKALSLFPANTAKLTQQDMEDLMSYLSRYLAPKAMLSGTLTANTGSVTSSSLHAPVEPVIIAA